MKKNFSILRSTLARAALGITSQLTLAWFLWPDAKWQVHPDALAAFVVAFIAWFIAETAPEPKRVSEHDQQLFQKFRDLIDEDERSFFRDVNLGGSFNWKDLKGTRTLAEYWKDVDYQFDDVDIQRKFCRLIDLAKLFIRSLSSESDTFSTSNWASIVPEEERCQDRCSEKTEIKIDKFNEMSAQLGIEMEAFITFARHRLVP